MNIFLAILFGTLFGFILHRVGVANPHLLINMLRLKDFHLMKAILLGIAFASFLLFIGLAIGIVDSAHLSVKTSYWGVITGGVILGIGWAISGYCPGTGVAAIGAGRKDALFFVFGGLIGAFVYTVIFSQIKDASIFEKILGGKTTLAQTGSSFDALISNIPGALVAIPIAIIFGVVAWKLPDKIEG